MVSKVRIAIVGAGNVGATLAYTVVMRNIADEVCLIDVNKEKAYAEARDIQDAMYFMGRNTKVWAGDYADTKDADVLVVTASAPQPKDAHNRLEMLKPSMKIMKAIIASAMEAGFSGKIVVVSNPVDVMTYYAWKLSGLDKSQVIGSGTTLDSARLTGFIARDHDIRPDEVSAYVLGEHGDSEICAWSAASCAGMPIRNLFAHHTDPSALEADYASKTKLAGWEVFSRKGNTCYGIAMSTAAIVEALVLDNGCILPVTTCIEGEYHLHDVWISTPVLLGKDGIIKRYEVPLSELEHTALKKSADLLASFYSELQSAHS